jgi:hypothetical protein
MAESLEELVSDFGGIDSVNALWRKVSGGIDFIDPEKWKSLGAFTIELPSLNGPATVTILGTAHTSRRCAAFATAAVRELCPDCLMLERCPKRLDVLSMPKESFMDYTRGDRLCMIEGKAVDVEEAYCMRPCETDSDSTLAHKLFVRYKVLNSDKNSIVEEAAFDEFSKQVASSKALKLLGLGDKLLSTTISGDKSPTRSTLDSSLSERDAHMAAAVRVAVEFGRARQVLAIVGAHHVKGLILALKNLPVMESRIVRGVFLETRAILCIARRRAFWQNLVKHECISVNKILAFFNFGVENTDLAELFATQGWATSTQNSNEWCKWLGQSLSACKLSAL